jgi:uncharacterized membrane protein YhhN
LEGGEGDGHRADEPSGTVANWAQSIPSWQDRARAMSRGASQRPPQSLGLHPRLGYAYGLLSAASIALIPLGPFAGLGIVRMAPTVLLALGVLRGTRPLFGVTVTAALLCGALGDYFLNTFDPDLGVWGVVAFLVGHVFYIAGLRRGGWHPTPSRRRLVGALWAFGLGYGAIIAWVNPLQAVSSIAGVALTPAPQMLPVAPALIAYMPALIGMACVAVLRRGSRVLAAGALVFVASDAIIPLNQFLLPKAHPGDLYASAALLFPGFITYYLAQYLIARGAIADAASQPVPAWG